MSNRHKGALSGLTTSEPSLSSNVSIITKKIIFMILSTKLHVSWYTHRVIMAKTTLEATAQLQGLSDCLDYLTPEWLQSLILHGQSVLAPGDVAASVRECPERCLELLQVCNVGSYNYSQLVHMCLSVKCYGICHSYTD